ncbi:PREDICTED: uncharacterized protein LOC105853409 [Condylura cristata]|uniref:uncharacterized protein LOC105853409 n=1 Tax=Condylura cristata TaxID=143302 RepID=UPI0006437045|nr:PREDICTED: uncharacterized protein LOC105853409 [Condylura cristata]XP_012578123.1 PREDICTED: uncharacterized protein LOC105853409 [Condylura cristata]
MLKVARTFLLLRMLIIVPSASLDNYFWAITRTWPTPFPVHNESLVLPQFYATSCTYGTPCNPKPTSIQEEKFNASRFSLAGTLCFSVALNATDCILLSATNLSVFADPLLHLDPGLSASVLVSALTQAAAGKTQGSGSANGTSDAVNVTTFLVNVSAITPNLISTSENWTFNRSYPLTACRKTVLTFPPEFADCRDTRRPAQKDGWALWPSRFGRWKEKRLIADHPLSAWVLQNVKGATCDLSPFIHLQPSTIHLSNVTGCLNTTSKKLTLHTHRLKDNFTSPGGVVCVDPPFLFLLFNASSESSIDCTTTNCLLSQCWRKTHTYALSLRLPTFVPLPVQANPQDFPVTALIRSRCDFGLTAALVAAIAASIGAAAAAAVAMQTSVQTVAVVNEVIQKTSSSLQTQERLNRHLTSGILLLNKRIDLKSMESNVLTLFDIVSLSCVAKTPHMCVTPYYASLNESRRLSSLLAGNWTREFECLQNNFTAQIVALNMTKAEVVTVRQFTDWLWSSFSFFKEWVGVGMFAAVLVAGLLLLVFLWFRTVRAHRRDKAAITRALIAMDAGHSPQAWISLLREA